MDFPDPEPVQFRINGVNLKKFVDSELLGMLDKEFKDLKVVSLTFVTKFDDDRNELITAGHPFMELEEKDQLIVDANEPQSLIKFIDVLKNYNREE